MEAKYITHSNIDFEKWDQCVDNSENSLVYAYSWYLNSLVGIWDGIVLGDYEAIFPLPKRKKYGIQYLYQPFFTQQLGLFSTCDIAESLIKSTLEAIPNKFKYWDIQLNSENELFNKFHPLISKATFHLSLNRPYSELQSGFSKDARKSIRKAGEISGWNLKETLDTDSLIEDYKAAYASLASEIENKDYTNFSIAVEEAQKRGKVEILELLDENSRRMASGIFFKSKKYYHYVFGAPTEDGRKRNSTHVLIDKFIEMHSQEEMVLDFEGSEIPSVAYFYKKFGPKPVEYYRLKLNKLPLLYRLLKG